MNVSLLTHYGPNQRTYAELTNQNKEAYCARHGYSFFPFAGTYRACLPYGFERIAYVYDSLFTYDTGLDAIIYQSPDTLVMNMTKSIEELASSADHDFFITSDKRGLNSNSFIVRKSEWSRAWLTFILSQAEDYRLDDGHEASVIQHNRFDARWGGKIAVLDAPGILTPWDSFEVGDYLVRLPNMPAHERVTFIKSPTIQDAIIT